MIGDLQWHRADRRIDLLSISRHAARQGCLAAEAVKAATAPLAFWEPETALRISARAAPGSARVLGQFAAEALLDRDDGRPTRWPFEAPDDVASPDPEEVAPYRACDAVSRVQHHAAMARVRGIEAHPCLASSLHELLGAARSDGIVLGGWGWRSTSWQIRLRQMHCPLPSRHAADYWTMLSLMPSSECTPPVAPPTSSAHEYGLAVDFYCGSERYTITRRSRCYRWLADNAHRFGLYNLTSEPWHWSTTGR